jgi:hypothetical protein
MGVGVADADALLATAAEKRISGGGDVTSTVSEIKTARGGGGAQVKRWAATVGYVSRGIFRGGIPG